MLTFDILVELMLTQVIAKTLYEIIVLPITIQVVKFVKRADGTDAYDEHGIAHSVHPDSGIPYKGEPIPCWRALVDLSKSMAENIPEMTYIGWDMALTPDGWEPVEANRGEFIAQQITQGRGLRHEFELMCGIR